MSAKLRVLIEEAPKGKRWVAIAGDWPGLERNGNSEEESVAKLRSYVPRYLTVARRARLGAELERQPKRPSWSTTRGRARPISGGSPSHRPPRIASR